MCLHVHGVWRAEVAGSAFGKAAGCVGCQVRLTVGMSHTAKELVSLIVCAAGRDWTSPVLCSWEFILRGDGDPAPFARAFLKKPLQK